MSKLHIAEQYAEAVVNGQIVVCEYVVLAVQRYYADIDCALDRGWYFDRKAAQRAIKFIENLKHTKGVDFPTLAAQKVLNFLCS